MYLSRAVLRFLWTQVKLERIAHDQNRGRVSLEDVLEKGNRVLRMVLLATSVRSSRCVPQMLNLPTPRQINFDASGPVLRCNEHPRHQLLN